MAKPGSHGKDKAVCGTCVCRRHGFCRKWPVPGRERCRLYGGRSTLALIRSLAAMRAGRQRWLEESGQESGRRDDKTPPRPKLHHRGYRRVDDQFSALLVATDVRCRAAPSVRPVAIAALALFWMSS
jgi:hypothetical protein